MKTILFITNVPVPYRVEFFRMLSKNVQLTVIFEEKVGEYQYNYDYNYERLNVLFLKNNNKNNLSLYFKELRQKYDFIIFGDYSSKLSLIGIAYCRIHRIKYCIELDGAILHKESIFKHLLKKYALKKSILCLSSSESSDLYLKRYGVKDSVIKRYHFSSVKDNEVVNDDFSLEERNSAKKELSLNNDALILFVGRFIERKGLDVLIKSLPLINFKFQLVCVGGVPDANIKKEIDDSNISCQFIDFALSDLVEKYYLAADIFVLPTREEVWGLVINEAMAKGCYVVSTDNCVAAKEMIVEGSNGYISKAGDSVSLAESINKCAKLYNDCPIAIRSVSIARSYTIEKMVDDHLKIFEVYETNGKQ